MNKQSFTEELKEHLGALEAKLEAEIGENIKLLGDLRYYEEMRIPELERQLAEARAEIENLKWHINNEKAKAEAALELNGKALALAAEAQAEIERKDRQIAEANIEIEGLEEEIVALCDRLKRVNGGELRKQLAEARAEIESLKLSAGELNGAFNARPKCEKCKDKDKLIGQMAGALNHCKSTFEDYVKIHKAKMPVVTIGPIPPNWGDMQRKIARNQEAFDLCNAALSAAERGE